MIPERFDELNAAQKSTVLYVFADDCGTAQARSSSSDHCVAKREPIFVPVA